jgi:crotonobetainyl-CoA:carnitine CoA-transferase CaiB-like acyl-CoA transferase
MIPSPTAYCLLPTALADEGGDVDKPLAGLKVRSAAGSPAAELAEFLLADLGATIVRVPVGVAADLTDHNGEAPAGGVVLSPYGSRGRYADGPAHYSAIAAVGGALMAQYTYTPGPAYLVTPYATAGQGLLAVAAILARAIDPSYGSREISGLHGLLALQAGHYVFGPEGDPHRFRHSPRGQWPSYAAYKAADDWLFIAASTHTFLIKVLQVLDLDELLDDPRTHDGPRAMRGTDLESALWERIADVVRRHPRDHWLAVFAEAGIPAGPILTIEEALAHPHIRAVGLAEPGEPIGRLTRLSAVERRGAARPRQTVHAGPLPLSVLRVVELAGYIAGSYVGRLLADLGADVVKIEPPDGDPFRTLGYGFVAWNHGKRSLALNLRADVERQRLLALVREADVLVTNYRPEALDRMGVGREHLFAVNPALLHCTVSAFGERGPLARLPGLDPVVQGFAGLLKRQGGEDEPVKSQMAATDYLSGMLGAIGVLAGRYAQLQHGGGAVISTSLLAAALLCNESAYEDVREGRPYLTGGRDFKGPHPLNGLHAAGDSWLLTVAPDADPGAHPEALRYLDGGAVRDRQDEAITRLVRLGIPTVPCLDPETLPADPHFVENGLWLTIDQPDLGRLTFPAPVLGPADRAIPAPLCGEHNAVTAPWQGVPTGSRALMSEAGG